MIMTNRKLTRSFDSVKKIFLKIVIGVVLACILFVCFLYTNNEIGVTSSKLEADIRSSQKIKDDWTVDGSVSSTMAAYISYPQDLLTASHIPVFIPEAERERPACHRHPLQTGPRMGRYAGGAGTLW